MVFGEKMYKLRKEKGLSQEALAEQIGTTRQAISKWENNQGFPETEKLMLIANIFNVSVDYLLKENEALKDEPNESYYVSREKAESWILHERNTVNKLGLGTAILICAGIPFLIFKEQYAIRIISVISFILIGIIIIFRLCITDSDYEFRKLKQQPLLFDRNYIDELSIRYNGLRKKYLNMMTPLPIIFILGASMIVVSKYYELSLNDDIIPVFLFLIAFSIYMFLYGSVMKEAYELLIRNDEYISKWSTRLRMKFDAWLNFSKKER